MIRLAITSDKRQKGVNSLAQAGKMLQVQEVQEALRQRWTSDAHFVTYEVQGEKTWPRVNKPCLGELQEAGAVVVANMIVLDYDNNENVPDEILFEYGWEGNRKKLPKIPWYADRRKEFAAELDGLRVHMEREGLAMPTCIYPTQNGARMIHMLAEPCPVEKIEARALALRNEYRKAGMNIDEACKDWTRLFRLPFVTRDGKPTWEQPYAHFKEFPALSWDDDEWLVWQSLTPTTDDNKVDRFSTIDVTTDPAPDADEVEELLTIEGKPTQAFKDAKRFLRGRDCYPTCFECRELSGNDGRDNTLTKLIGEAVKMLHGKPGMSEEMTFALFHQAVEQLEPDDGTPDWFAKAWGLVTRFWAKEDAIAEYNAKELAMRQAEAHEKVDRIADAVERTSDLPELRSESEVERREAMSRQLILRVDRAFYVMQPNGHYSPIPVDNFGLPGYIRQLGMDDVIELVKEGKAGQTYKRAEDLFMEHGRTISEARGKIGLEGGVFDGEILWLPMYARDPLRVARFSHSVDEWLRLLVDEDEDKYRLLCKWIGYSLDFEGGPICALSIAGPPAVGKKLLARGLQECIDTGLAARKQAITTERNAILRKTPFLIIDEGMPRSLTNDPADTFREMVSGEDIVTRELYKSPVTINNPLRILMTANNLEVVQSLTKNKDLSVEDQQALAQRILHFNVSQKAATWLKMNGGKKFTDGWIQGDGNFRESDYIVADHFTWLYENRAQYGEPEDRLLVQGNSDSEIIQHMRTGSGVAPRVVEILVWICNTPPAQISNQIKSAVAIDDEGFWVTGNAIRNFPLDAMAGNEKQVSHRRAGEVLRSLSLTIDIPNPRIKALDGREYRLRWWKLDLPALLDRAMEYGIPSTRLEGLVEQFFKDKDKNKA